MIWVHFKGTDGSMIFVSVSHKLNRLYFFFFKLPFERGKRDPSRENLPADFASFWLFHTSHPVITKGVQAKISRKWWWLNKSLLCRFSRQVATRFDLTSIYNCFSLTEYKASFMLNTDNVTSCNNCMPGANWSEYESFLFLLLFSSSSFKVTGTRNE